VAPPFKQAEFDIMYGAGISREGEIIDLGVQANIVDKAGAWFSYGGTRIGQGKDNAREYLKEHPEMAIEIENRVREQTGVIARAMTVPADSNASDDSLEDELAE
jgi:recombination protein RecA